MIHVFTLKGRDYEEKSINLGFSTDNKIIILSNQVIAYSE
jgi:hypothetical protein